MAAALLGARVQQQLLVPAIRYSSLAPVAQLAAEQRKRGAPRFACAWTHAFERERRPLTTVLRSAACNQYVVLFVYPSMHSFERGAGQKAKEMKTRRGWRRLWTILVSDARNEDELETIPKAVRPVARSVEEWMTSVATLSRKV